MGVDGGERHAGPGTAGSGRDGKVQPGASDAGVPSTGAPAPEDMLPGLSDDALRLPGYARFMAMLARVRPLRALRAAAASVRQASDAEADGLAALLRACVALGAVDEGALERAIELPHGALRGVREGTQLVTELEPLAIVQLGRWMELSVEDLVGLARADAERAHRHSGPEITEALERLRAAWSSVELPPD